MVTVTFQPTARQRAQIYWACTHAGVPYEPGEIPGTICLSFDDDIELLAWSHAFALDFHWCPLDIKVAVAEAPPAQAD